MSVGVAQMAISMLDVDVDFDFDFDFVVYATVRRNHVFAFESDDDFDELLAPVSACTHWENWVFPGTGRAELLRRRHSRGTRTS